MLVGGDGALFQLVACLHRRQFLGVLVFLVVAALLIERQEAVEEHDLAGGAQVEMAGADLGRDIDRGALHFGRFHLARDGALPDQFVELGLLRLKLARDHGRQPCEIGRTDGLMGLLRVLGLDHVFARRVRDVFRAEFLADDAARRCDGRAVHVDAVGSHIGDEADGLAADIDAFIEPLSELHRPGRGEAELARGFLLQRRGLERRLRMTLDRLGLDLADGEERGFQRRLEGLGFLFVADIETGDLLAVGADEPGLEGLAGRGRERRDQRPVFAGAEGLDLALAVANEAQRHRLHAAGRAGARELAPQHRREREADEIVERTACQIGIDQCLVDRARIGQRLLHGVLGHRVEGDALDRDALQHLLLVQRLQHMPGDRLSLAIRVGCEDELLGAFDGARDLGDLFGAAALDLPFHGEVAVGLHRAVLGRQVADMPERGDHLVVGAQVFVDRLGLGRRLDDEELHDFRVSMTALIRARNQP